MAKLLDPESSLRVVFGRRSAGAAPMPAPPLLGDRSDYDSCAYHKEGHVRETTRQGHELDLVVFESTAFGVNRITAIGEAKGTAKPMDLPHLERLEHLRGLLPSARVGALPKLLLFARSGFSGVLRNTAKKRGDVELIDLGRLYRGD